MRHLSAVLLILASAALANGTDRPRAKPQVWVRNATPEVQVSVDRSSGRVNVTLDENNDRKRSFRDRLILLLNPTSDLSSESHSDPNLQWLSVLMT